MPSKLPVGGVSQCNLMETSKLISHLPPGFCALILTKFMKSMRLFPPPDKEARISLIMEIRLERCSPRIMSTPSSSSTKSNVRSKSSVNFPPRTPPSECPGGTPTGILSTIDRVFMNDASSRNSEIPSAVLKLLIPNKSKFWRIMPRHTCNCTPVLFEARGEVFLRITCMSGDRFFRSLVFSPGEV